MQSKIIEGYRSNTAIPNTQSSRLALAHDISREETTVHSNLSDPSFTLSEINDYFAHNSKSVGDQSGSTRSTEDSSGMTTKTSSSDSRPLRSALSPAHPQRIMADPSTEVRKDGKYMGYYNGVVPVLCETIRDTFGLYYGTEKYYLSIGN